MRIDMDSSELNAKTVAITEILYHLRMTTWEQTRQVLDHCRELTKETRETIKAAMKGGDIV
jgi:hypothetical protein